MTYRLMYKIITILTYILDTPATLLRYDAAIIAQYRRVKISYRATAKLRFSVIIC